MLISRDHTKTYYGFAFYPPDPFPPPTLHASILHLIFLLAFPNLRISHASILHLIQICLPMYRLSAPNFRTAVASAFISFPPQVNPTYISNRIRPGTPPL